MNLPEITEILLIILHWKETINDKFNRLEIQDEEKNTIFSAVVLPPNKQYQLPPFIRQLAQSTQLKWRISAIDESGKPFEETAFADVK